MIILSEIFPTLCSKVQIFVTPKKLFFFAEPKSPNLTNSSLAHYAWPTQIQKDWKVPNLKLIFTMKLLHTHFWQTLPLGDLFGHLVWVTQKLSSLQQQQLLRSPNKHSRLGIIAWKDFKKFKFLGSSAQNVQIWKGWKFEVGWGMDVEMGQKYKYLVKEVYWRNALHCLWVLVSAFFC